MKINKNWRFCKSLMFISLLSLLLSSCLVRRVRVSRLVCAGRVRLHKLRMLQRGRKRMLMLRHLLRRSVHLLHLAILRRRQRCTLSVVPHLRRQRLDYCQSSELHQEFCLGVFENPTVGRLTALWYLNKEGSPFPGYGFIFFFYFYIVCIMKAY